VKSLSDTLCFIITLLGQFLPLYDGMCSRSLNFIKTCVHHKSKLIRANAIYMVSGPAAIIRFFGIMFSFVLTDTELILMILVY